MLNALCAGSANVADIIVLVVLVLGVLVGVVAGFAKMLNGFFGTILAIVISIVCAVFLADKLAGVSFLAELANTIDTKMVEAAAGLGLDARVEDSIVYLNNSGTWTPLTELYTEGIAAKVVGIAQSVIAKVFGGALDGTTSIAAVTAALTTKIVAGAIIVVGGIIVLEILFSLLAKGLYALGKKQKPIRTIDHLFGLVFSAAISVLIVFVIMFVVAKLGDKAAGFTDMINSSSVAKWFFENNPFAALA